MEARIFNDHLLLLTFPLIISIIRGKDISTICLIFSKKFEQTNGFRVFDHSIVTNVATFLLSYLFTIAVGRFRSICNESELPLLESDICVWYLGETDSDSKWAKRTSEIIEVMEHFQVIHFLI